MVRIYQGLIKRRCTFSGLRKTVMHIVDALIHRCCIFMTFIKSWCAFLRRSQWGATPIRQYKLSIYDACRMYEPGSCVPVSRPTMSYSVGLPNAQALCTPPSRKLRDVSGSLHPHDEVADSLRLGALFVHSTQEIFGRLRLCAPPC